jgi:bifunctional non-homologous end joining protein LigD
MPAAKTKSKHSGSVPSGISPMLATLVDQPFNDDGWIYEVKWDGYRAMAVLDNGTVELLSRNNKSFNDTYYPVYDTLRSWKINAVIDGEIVVVNNSGQADFSALQNWRSEADGQLLYYVFDLLWLNGEDLTSAPLAARRSKLQSVLPQADNIRISEAFDIGGKAFFKTASEMGLEGIMAKKADSTYSYGARTKDWLKIKTLNRQEVVIGGFTHNEGSPKPFSALLIGVYKGTQLHYIGKIGTGFSDKLQQQMMQQFKPLIRKKIPFDVEPDINKPSRFRPNPPHATATWLKPELVCEVSYREITQDGVLRHPSFEGMRSDKAARDVKLEQPQHTEQLVAEDVKRTIVKPAKNKERKTLLNPSEKTQVREINGHELKFNNLDKIFWPKEKLTKRDLLNYYYQVAPYMLPYLKDRPQTLYRYPNGIEGKSFYQKDVTGKVPGWIETYAYYSQADAREKHFMVCSDEASLLYMASMACIEINPWSSRTQKPDHPDWCIIDLDPDKNTFEQVIKTALVTKDILDAVEVPCYCKTSGSTGLHIYIPFGAKYTYEQSKEFGRVIAKLVHAETSRFTSIERATADRGGKMYIDFLQNRPQATLAAPYSVRPRPGATVSMPLHWTEVKKGLKMKYFTMTNAVSRLKAEGDLFAPVIAKGIDLKKAIKRIETIFG